jgi:hypothetical protein
LARFHRIVHLILVGLVLLAEGGVLADGVAPHDKGILLPGAKTPNNAPGAKAPNQA